MKLDSLWVVVLALWAASPCLAFWPPLRDVQAWVVTEASDRVVHLKVYDPVRSKWQETTVRHDGSSSNYWNVRAPMTQDGFVVWLADRTRGAYSNSDEVIYNAIYDPGRGTWQISSTALTAFSDGTDFWTILPPIINGGVVAWIADRNKASHSNSEERVYFTTYDPQTGTWQSNYITFTPVSDITDYWSIGPLVVQDGLATVKADRIRNSRITSDERVYSMVYDPVKKSWQTDQINYIAASDGIDYWSVYNLRIENLTVKWTAERIKNGSTIQTDTRVRGYDAGLGNWYAGTTKPLSRFTALPVSGTPPLGVWLMDISLGATAWSWSFGDGASSTERSILHTYTTHGFFITKQTATGTAGSHSSETNIITDFQPPVGSIAINNGAAVTKYTSVTLNLSAADNSGSVAEMRFSSNGSTWLNWEPYASVKAWMLPSGDGTKPVYVQFRDAAQNSSPTYSDSINLDTSVPSCTLNTGWNCVSIPIEPLNPDPLVVFSEIDVLNSSLQYWQNDVDGGGFRSYGSVSGWTGPLIRGISYWLLNPGDPKTVNFAGTISSTDFHLQIPAHSHAPFWITIGTPFPTDIACSSLLLRNAAVSPDGKSWIEAYNLGMVGSLAMGFNSSTQQFFTAGPSAHLPSTMSLQSGYGYWLLVNRPEALTVTFPRP